MTDLRVDAPALRGASRSLLSAVSSLELPSTMMAPSDDLVGSPDVEAALRLGSRHHALRAELVAGTLGAVGSLPSSAAGVFTDADAAMARAF